MDLSPLRKFEVLGPDAEALLQATRHARRPAARGRPGRLHGDVQRDRRDARRRDRVPARRRTTSAGSAAPTTAASGSGSRPSGSGCSVWVKESTDELHNVAVQGPAQPRDPAPRSSGRRRRRRRSPSSAWFRFSVARLGGPTGSRSSPRAPGYTGELGYELFCHPSDAPAALGRDLEAGEPHGLTPLGLDALDMLRIEAGLIFAGPRVRRPGRPVRGRDRVHRDLRTRRGLRRPRGARGAQGAPAAARSSGSSSRATRPPAHGDCVHVGRQQVGVVTSGTRSPVLKKTIALVPHRGPVRRARDRGRGRQARRPSRSGSRRPSSASRSTTPTRRRPRLVTGDAVESLDTTSRSTSFDRDGFLIVEEGLISDRGARAPARALRAAVRRRLRDGDQARRGQLGARPRPRGPHAAALQRVEGGHGDRGAGALASASGGSRRSSGGTAARGSCRTTSSGSRPGRRRSASTRTRSYADYLVPPEMLTCWMSLHETTADAGPIAYVRGSNHWAVSPPARSQFHAPEDWLAPASGTRSPPRARARDRAGRRQGRAAARSTTASTGTARRRTRAARSRGWRSSRTCSRSNARFHETNVDLNYSRYRRRGDLSMDESFFPVLWDRDGLPDALARRAARRSTDGAGVSRNRLASTSIRPMAARESASSAAMTASRGTRSVRTGPSAWTFGGAGAAREHLDLADQIAATDLRHPPGAFDAGPCPRARGTARPPARRGASPSRRRRR